MAYRNPRARTTALDEIEDLAGEYWQRGDGTAQRVYDAVALELAERQRKNCQDVTCGPYEAQCACSDQADLIDPGKEQR